MKCLAGLVPAASQSQIQSARSHPPQMNYHAHTAATPDGKSDPDQTRWQPLAEHLRNVADLPKQFAVPLGLATEAELAGLLHEI